jgi:hypothetical protein
MLRKEFAEKLILNFFHVDLIFTFKDLPQKVKKIRIGLKKSRING